MINILKPFGEWVTALKRDKFRLATLKLTFFYVLSTAVILIVSSSAILLLFTPSEIDLSFESELFEQKIEIEHDEWSLYEVREHLVDVVVIVDLVVLMMASALSYHFARRTLLPIKKMHEEQQKFMGDVAHELRTPLSVVRAGAETVLRKSRSTLEYEEFITDVQGEVERLTRLSNQLLRLLGTNELNKTTFKEIDLSRIAKAEVKRFLPYAQGQQIIIEENISPDILILSDADSLIEIIQNLLKNAIDYNKKDGVVTLSLLENKSSVVLEVNDTGVGIPLELQAKVFNRFIKGDSARTAKVESGSGLGLSIVKALVEKLHGQINLSSTPNIGTKITVTLPKIPS